MGRFLNLSACFLTLAISTTGCGPKYPKCSDDGDCRDGEFCVNGQCQLCRDDSDCAPGESCNGGRCDPIAGYCDDSRPCPDGQECTDNRCVQAVQATEELPPPAAVDSQCELAPVYFDFDADALDQVARNAIQNNINCLNERGLSGLHLTGHCDPRGTEEYNLALGDRRARAVMQYMASMGVSRSKLSASSMGEEMARGTDESSWSRDRRVEVRQR